ncbi:MAG: diguanylate cyclase/phosphodiesterase, partial [Frankiales bacterium]|nr:diguanylate cyclase/phosphodiesterase [Frankiales bacterium]
EAAQGTAVVHLTYLNADADDDSDSDAAVKSDSDADADVTAAERGPRSVEVYQPLMSAQTGTQIGILELYLPYAPIAHDIASGRRLVTIVLGSGLFLLWLCLLGVSVSVTRRLRRQAAENGFLASHDALTGMPNRTQFGDRAEAAIAVATVERPVAIALIDLDRFKEVNDTLVHDNVDKLLVSLAERLKLHVREGDTIARLGGDEFGVVLSRLHGPGETVEVLSRLRAVLAEPLLIDGLPLAVEASVGFALAPSDAADLGTLLQQADVAMYAAKNQHLGIAHYRADYDHFDASSLSLIAELGAAIAQDQLVLHYQPKADLEDGTVTAVEALVRWQHPIRGLLYPDSFVPAAEQTELIDELTRWVLRKATSTLGELDPSGTLAIAVNISARSLGRADFAQDVLQILHETGTDPRRVMLEITETALMADPARAAGTLHQLHQAGLRLSIDDFGAGQTSLGYLATLPITELKIDKAFVLAMHGDERNAAIVRSVIELGHSLGFTVTAEGVETVEALEQLSSYQCDTVQGYLLSRPVGSADLATRMVAARAILDANHWTPA